MSSDEQPPASRFEMLSRSESGLHYVREKKGGVMRVLSDSELADFSDPPPCPECAEQFGCDHFNCAGEALLGEEEWAAAVPAEWRAFARDHGVSRGDLDRLGLVEQAEGEYRVRGEVKPDMRTLEIVLLLNEAR